MAQLYNYSTKQWQDVDPKDIPSLVQSGSHGFEAAASVPMVADNGEVGDVSGNDAAEAFRRGYRLATPEDTAAQYDRDHLAQLRERFDNPLLAAEAGVVRGASGGLMDVVGNAYSKMTGKGEDYANAANALKEENPIASTIGEIGGTVTSLGAGRFAGAAGHVAEGLAARAASPLASDIVSKIAPKMLGSAIEGATLQGFNNISEAALGDPNDVATHLTANYGMAALIGGGLGAAFGAASKARPVFDKYVDKGTQYLENQAVGAAQKVAEPAVRRSFEAAGVEGADDLASSLVKNTGDARQAMSEFEAGVPQQVEQAGAEAEKALTREQKIRAKAVLDDMKDLNPESPAARAELKVAATAAGGDLSTAQSMLYQGVRSEQAALDDYLFQNLSKVAPQPGLREAAADSMDKVITGLRETGEPLNKTLADSLESVKNARFGKEFASAEEEVKALTAVQQRAAKIVRRASEFEGNEAQGLVRGLREHFNDVLMNRYPDAQVNAFAQKIGSQYEAITAIGKFVNKGNPTTKIAKLFTDPEAFPTINAALDRMSQFSPEIKAFNDAKGNALKQHAIATEAFGKFLNQTRDLHLAGQQMDGEAFREMLSIFGESAPADTRKAAEHYAKIDQIVQASKNMSPVDRAINLQRALGKDTSELEKYASHARVWDAFEKAEANAAGQHTFGRTLGRMGAGIAGHALGHLAAPGVFGAGRIGGTIGRTLFDRATGGVGSAVNTIKTLAAVEKAANKGARALNDGIKNATTALLSDTARSVSTRAAIKYTSEQQRERFKAVQAAVTDHSTPDRLMDAMGDSLRGLPQAPNLKTALSQRISTNLAYIQQNMPKDPRQGAGLVGGKPYQPSDYEIGNFLGIVDAVNNPLHVVEKIGAGTVKPAEIAALKATDPGTYSKLQQSAVSAIMDHGGDIPYSKKVVLQQVLGIPADFSLQPSFVSVMQQNLATPDQGGRPQGATDSQPRSRRPKLDTKPMETQLTASDRLAFKGQDE